MIAAELAALAGVLAVVLAVTLYTLLTGVPPVPTSPKVRAAMMAALPARIEGKIVELGAGWGALAIALAERYPEACVVGFEISPLPWAVARLRAASRRRPNLAVRRADFMKQPLDDAALVVCYLAPGAMERLGRKLDRELAPGAVVASSTFAIVGWEPERVVRADDLYATPVYLYRAPGRPGGAGP